MLKNLLFFLFTSLASNNTFAQNTDEIYTTDINNFWIAYDSVNSTTDTAKQIFFIQALYLNKASDGLKDFMKLRRHSAKIHLQNILDYPKFWESVRQNTLQIKNHASDIGALIARLKKIYRYYKPVKIYFTIGVLNSGGTVSRRNILIGAEIACADKETNASELNPWLQKVFTTKGTVTAMVAHEIGHTQQHSGNSENLLGQSIKEGACDFLAELIYKPVSSPYIDYGNLHEKQIWSAFKKEMNDQNYKNWLYNGNEAPGGVADLGYFIGYQICKSYYGNALNKKKAIRKIIGLKYNKKAALKFLIKSQYNEKPK